MLVQLVAIRIPTKSYSKLIYSNNSQIVNVDNHALCDNLDIIKRGLSAGTGKLCIFGHLGLVFIWSCFVSCLLLLLYYVICAPVLTEGTIKSEICQSNKHGRDKMPTSESQHVVSILKAFFVFFRKAIESCDRELLFYSKFCNTSN